MKRVLPVLLCVLALGACVERKMIVKSEPDGADLWFNRAEAPVKTTHEEKFDQHGTFTIRLEKNGYLPIEERARVPTPWYSYPVLDLITEVLVPFTIRDHHEFEYRLTPVPEPKSWAEAEAEVIRHREEVIGRANDMRSEVMGTAEFPLDIPGISSPGDSGDQ